MDFAEVLLRVLGFARNWSDRMRGFAFLLALPILVVIIANWRVRRRR
jgi:hypothetical protein